MMAREKLPRGTCKHCSKLLDRRDKIYCNNKCQWTHIRFERFNRGTLRAPTIKKMVLKLNNHKCEICKTENWMGDKVPLILDHIDGNSKNNRLENLRLVCGNCDMQLPTYKNKNQGNGRAYRRKRYEKGLSY